MNKRALTVAGALVLLAASTAPFLLRTPDPFEQSGLASLLLELRGLDASLTSDVLQLRLGVESNYDSLTSRLGEIESRAEEFVKRSASLDERVHARLGQTFAPFHETLVERRRILEAFPVDNATLNNSLRLLGATYERARSRLDEQGEGGSSAAGELDRIIRQTLQYYAYADEPLRAALLASLDASADAGGPSRAMLGHARIVVQQKALVDDHVRRLVATSGEPALLETFALFEDEGRAWAAHVANMRALLSGLCMLVVVVTCAAGMWAALRQSAALEREIKERVRADEEARKLEAELRQAQKLESIGQLAAGIAHEINTPIQFVSDSVHFVRDAWRDLALVLDQYRELQHGVTAGTATVASAAALAEAEEAADIEYLLDNAPKAVERSLEGLERVATIVRSLKEFAHPEQKEMAPVDLNHAIQSTLTIARNEYKYVAELETDFGEVPPVTCHGGEVNQAVLNILVNAAHAIADKVKGTESRGRILVRTRHEGEFVVIAISDTGGGIPEAIRERIFDPFFTTKEVGKGTGQGLAIARSVVAEKHGGSLTFESEVGKGTTFFLRLPLVGKPRVAPVEGVAAA